MTILGEYITNNEIEEEITETGLATTTQSLIYTVGTGKKAKIKSIVISNVNNAVKYATLYLFPSGVSTPADQYILGNKMFKLNGTDATEGAQTYTYNNEFIAEAGATIQIVSETANTMKYNVLIEEWSVT